MPINYRILASCGLERKVVSSSRRDALDRLHYSLLDEFRAWTLHTLIVRKKALLRRINRQSSRGLGPLRVDRPRINHGLFQRLNGGVRHSSFGHGAGPLDNIVRFVGCEQSF